MRRFAFVIVMTLCPSWTSGQSSGFFCQFDDSTATVLCVKADATPVFTYVMPILDIASWLTLASSGDANEPASSPSEQCRLRTERFRDEVLEKKFNSSREQLRLTAEKVRLSNL